MLKSSMPECAGIARELVQSCLAVAVCCGRCCAGIYGVQVQSSLFMQLCCYYFVLQRKLFRARDGVCEMSFYDVSLYEGLIPGFQSMLKKKAYMSQPAVFTVSKLFVVLAFGGKKACMTGMKRVACYKYYL